ncbi:MAG: 16S rRNA (guanine(527)-N(7))-methyltransferase RsmG [Pseudomonadota bacterium]
MNWETLCDVSGVNVSRETFSRLEAFSNDFHIWADRINLVAPSTREEFWHRHVVDSLQLLNLRQTERHWVDLGSGGGFPGMVVAIALAEANDSRVTLVESNRKKCGFLQVAKAKYAPQAQVLPMRINEALPQIDPPQVVTARALAELDILLEMTQQWLSTGSVGLFMKGREYVGEVEKSRTKWGFDLVVYNSRTAPDSAILEVSQLTAIGS